MMLVLSRVIEKVIDPEPVLVKRCGLRLGPSDVFMWMHMDEHLDLLRSSCPMTLMSLGI